MLTFQIRSRAFLVRPGLKFPDFPVDCEVRFHFRPLQSFGKAAGDGRLFVQGANNTMTFDGHSGQYSVTADKPLSALAWELALSDGQIVLDGNVLTIKQRPESGEQLLRFMESIFYGLPPLLNIRFRDPPIIYNVEGKLGEVPFSWLCRNSKSTLRVTNQNYQQTAFETAWHRLPFINEAERADNSGRRLLAAAHYFHVACRLATLSTTPGEFWAEIILNFAKILEVLFPSSGATNRAMRQEPNWRR